MRTEQTIEIETQRTQRAGSLKVSVRSIACTAGTRLIPLTQGKFAIVDTEDFEWLNQYKWYAYEHRYTWYAIRYNQIRMHREILGLKAGDGIEIDHKDGNGLNNKHNNLRIATSAQNGRNRRPQKNGTSTFKGVSWHASKYAEVKTMNKIDEIKKKIENVRDLIIMQDGEAVYDCNFRELDEALALLESAKAGQPEDGEFTKAIRGFSGAIRNLPQYVGTTICSKFDEACDRLDAQQQEIKRLETLSDDYEEKIERLDRQVEELTAENKAHAEEIERLKAALVYERPFAECYRRVCETFQIEGGILDYIASLAAENVTLKTAIATPEVYAGVITKVVEDERDKVMAENKALTEQIEKLEKSKGNCRGCGEPIDHEYCQRCREQWAS